MIDGENARPDASKMKEQRFHAEDAVLTWLKRSRRLSRKRLEPAEESRLASREFVVEGLVRLFGGHTVNVTVLVAEIIARIQHDETQGVERTPRKTGARALQRDAEQGGRVWKMPANDAARIRAAGREAPCGYVLVVVPNSGVREIIGFQPFGRGAKTA